MEFDELLITTGVDALVRLVKEKQRIDIEEVSKILNIPVDQIEEWGRVLEEQGIIKIDYRLTKVYFNWISPTEEELSRETTSFYEKKSDISREIDDLKKNFEPEKEELTKLRGSFEDLYKKLYPKLQEFEKTIQGLPVDKSSAIVRFDAYLERLDHTTERSQNIKSSLDSIRDELANIGKQMKGTQKSQVHFEKIEKVKDELNKLNGELVALKKKAAQRESALPSSEEIPSINQMQSKLQELREEFTETKKMRAQIEKDSKDMSDASEVINDIRTHIKEYDSKLNSFRKEATPLLREMHAIEEKAARLASKLEQDTKSMEHFSDSIDVAKSIFHKFPTQKKFEEQLKFISTREKKIEEGITSLNKLFKMVGGKEMSAAEYNSLSEKIEDKMNELTYETDELSKALDEEKTTYLTFQKIKERVVPSLQSYENDSAKVAAELKKLREEIDSQKRTINEQIKQFSKNSENPEMANVLEQAKGIMDKKKSIEEISKSVMDMEDTVDNIAKKLTLLSRQAKFLELRSSKEALSSDEIKAEETEMRNQVTLTKAEEEEFKRKREELKNLIKNLWEKS